MYALNADFSVYGRVADGFRGPSIQGRDVAFFAPPSVAQSETVLSCEAGFKSTLLGDTLRLNAAAFTYEVSDIQLTAVGGGGNLVQLINADKGKAMGLRSRRRMGADRQPRLHRRLLLCRHRDRRSAPRRWRLRPVHGHRSDRRDRRLDPRAVDGNPFPNAPETIANFTARYADAGRTPTAEIFVFTDWAYQGATNLFLYESVEFQTDDQIEGGLKFGWAKTRWLARSRRLRPQHHGRRQHQGRASTSTTTPPSSTSPASSASR